MLNMSIQLYLSIFCTTTLKKIDTGLNIFLVIIKYHLLVDFGNGSVTRCLQKKF